MSTTTKLLGLSVVILGALLLSTQPEQLPSVVLIAPFLLFFLVLSLAIKLLFRGMGSQGRTGVILLFAGLPVVFLALQSLGQLTLRDVVMLLVLFSVAYFYMYRRAHTAN